MRSTFALGRVAGIEVGITWTWLLVVVVVVWVLARGVFPEATPGLSPHAYLAMGVVAALLFFASILLHELGHAVQARREGIEIEGITLWILGGVARFKGSFPSPGAELRMAVAGPVVSLVIGVGCVGVGSVVPGPPAIEGVVSWLGYINLILLGFNMLPALPLDGGRVLRCALWHFKSDFAGATRSAAWIGREFGRFLMIAGLLLLVVRGSLGGAWLMFIGAFLMAGAEAEGRVARARQALADVSVEAAMVRDPVSVPPHMTLDSFVRDVVRRHRHAAYPVVDETGRALGLISFRSVSGVPRSARSLRRVGDVMTPLGAAASVHRGASLGDVVIDLMESDVRGALVCDGDDLAGFLSVADAWRLFDDVEMGRATARPRERTWQTP